MDYFECLYDIRMNFWRVLNDSGNNAHEELESQPDCDNKSCNIVDFLYLWGPWTVQKGIILESRYRSSKCKPDNQKPHKSMHVKGVPLPSEGSDDDSKIDEKKPWDSQRSPMKIFPSCIGHDSGYCWGTNGGRNWISSYWV